MKSLLNSGFGAAALVTLFLASVGANAAEGQYGPAVAQVVSASGQVSAINDRGGERALAAGDAIYQGDRVETGAKSRAHLRFIDEAEMYLRSRSALKVSDYHKAGSAGEKSAGVMDLVRGSMRTVTGSIGKDADAYRLGTEVATMGVRGTDYVAVVCDNEGCPLSDYNPGRKFDNGLYTGTVWGAVYVGDGKAEANVPRDGVHRVASVEAGTTEVDVPAGFYSGDGPVEAPAAACWQGDGATPCTQRRWPHYR